MTKDEILNALETGEGTTVTLSVAVWRKFGFEWNASQSRWEKDGLNIDHGPETITEDLASSIDAVDRLTRQLLPKADHGVQQTEGAYMAVLILRATYPEHGPRYIGMAKSEARARCAALVRAVMQ